MPNASAPHSKRGKTATRVVLSYPEALSDWGRRQLDTDRYRAYLRRVLDDVAPGDTFEEFVDTGCCGSTLDIPFRVEAVESEDGTVHIGTETTIKHVGEETTIEYDTRQAPLDGGWVVQSSAGAKKTEND